MKFIQRLHRTWRWYRLGCSARKAWELAAPTGRKASYTPEILAIATMCAAYAAVAWNDAQLAREAALSATTQQVKAEVALVNMLSGKAMLVDEKTWTQCYTSTGM